jgi:hypothetical protein
VVWFHLKLIMAFFATAVVVEISLPSSADHASPSPAKLFIATIGAFQREDTALEGMPHPDDAGDWVLVPVGYATSSAKLDLPPGAATELPHFNITATPLPVRSRPPPARILKPPELSTVC